jgi:two-component system, NarL family, nitrate/nitrite response regulator NarL
LPRAVPDGVFDPTTTRELAYDPPMTRNPAIALRTALPVGPSCVAIVTDDALMRASVVRMFAATIDIRIVDVADANVILWDAGHDKARAIARLPEIRKHTVPVVAVIADGGQVAPALAAGARGVVQRDSIGPEWSAAIIAVERGLTVIDAPLAASLVPPVVANASPSLRSTTRPGVGQLTDRERQVVTLLAEGLSNKLIADRLGISDHTAKFHVNGVMAKLGAGTRTEAVVEAVRRGLVTL